MTEQSIAELFVAGVVPGIILTLLFFAMINIWARINPAVAPQGKSTTFREKLAALVGCADVLALVILVIVGLIIGWFTPTEAGAVGACGAILLSLIRRTLSWAGFKDAIVDAIQNTGMIFTIVMGALIFNAFFAVTTIPMELAEWVGRLDFPPPVIMIIILFLYVTLGTFLEELSMILLTLPIFYPIVVGIGYDPIWFGVVVVLIVEMGMISPPVGMTMFVVKGIAPDIPIELIFKGVLPFLISVLILMILMIAFPQMVLFLPHLMG
jgi:tripartite ATP-independent transporter DctM subunit